MPADPAITACRSPFPGCPDAGHRDRFVTAGDRRRHPPQARLRLRLRLSRRERRGPRNLAPRARGRPVQAPVLVLVLVPVLILVLVPVLILVLVPATSCRSRPARPRSSRAAFPATTVSRIRAAAFARAARHVPAGRGAGTAAGTASRRSGGPCCLRSSGWRSRLWSSPACSALASRTSAVKGHRPRRSRASCSTGRRAITRRRPPSPTAPPSR